MKEDPNWKVSGTTVTYPEQPAMAMTDSGLVPLPTSIGVMDLMVPSPGSTLVHWGSDVTTVNTGIFDITNEAYHAGPGISRSSLWTLHDKTPAHMIGGSFEETDAMKFGTACHVAVLEPEHLETRYSVVPPDAPNRPSSRQINAKKPSPESIAAIQWWQNWNAMNAGKTDISAEDYDAVRFIRDQLHADPLIQKLVRGAQFEKSAYWIDEETQELCRVRPDIYNPALAMMADVKTTNDASEWGFGGSIRKFGYYFQDAFYSDGWELAGGGAVDAFVFIAIEKKKPFVFQIYELSMEDKEKGRDDYKAALRKYEECKRLGQWPGYGGGVKPISMARWGKDRVGSFVD